MRMSCGLIRTKTTMDVKCNKTYPVSLAICSAEHGIASSLAGSSPLPHAPHHCHYPRYPPFSALPGPNPPLQRHSAIFLPHYPVFAQASRYSLPVPAVSVRENRRSQHVVPALGPVGWSLANLGRCRELAFPISLHLVGVSRLLSHRHDMGAFWEHEPGSAGSLEVASFCQGRGAAVRHLRGYGEKVAGTWKLGKRERTADPGIVHGFVECSEGLRRRVRGCGGRKGLLELRALELRRETSRARLLVVFLQSWGPEGSRGLKWTLWWSHR